jgi:glycosyltransferase involved in cell wall biosynthesis
MNEGGAQKRLVSLANRFAGRGHAVDLIAISAKGTVGRLVSAAVGQVGLHPAAKRPLIKLTAGLRPLTAFLKRVAPDVLMAGSNLAHVVAAMACTRVAEPPLLVLRAARHPLRKLPWTNPWKRVREYGHRPIERWAYRRADLVIAVSQESGAAIRGLVDDPDKVVVIPNPTITDQYLAQLANRPEHRWFDEAEAGGDPVILGVGRLTTQKDFETLVRAAAVVNRTRPVKLILLGEGRRRPIIEALIAEQGLAGQVEMMGHVDGIGGWLSRADLLVSSSLWEGSPGAIIEAFAAGCPVVATACPGGSVELLEGSAGGALVPMRDPAAMAAAILSQLERQRDRDALRALAEPYRDDGRADLLYLEAIAAAARRREAAAPGVFAG